MKQLNKILKKNPLRFTLILSSLLHLIGFYCLSSLSPYLPAKKAERVPIKIKVIVKKEKISQEKTKPEKVLLRATVSKYLDIKASQLHPPQESAISLKNRLAVSARSVHSTANSFTSFSPTNLYREPSQAISKTNNLPTHVKNTSISTTINFIKNITPASLHVRTTSLKSSSLIVLQKKGPAHTENYNNNYVNNSMIVSNSFISNKLEKNSKTLHARSPSKFHASTTLTHSPSRLVTQKVSELHFDPKPKIRVTSLANGFSDEYFDLNKIHPDHTSKSLKDGQVSTLELGRLRKGFVNQVRSNITKAKYYPRIARKHGFEGKPIVAFSLGDKGELINLLLDQPSVHKVLNDAALETIRRGAPYPPIPVQLKEKSINFKLPVLYILGEH